MFLFRAQEYLIILYHFFSSRTPACMPVPTGETRVLGTNFLGLNEDVLIQIFEELRPHQNLRPLSLTCRPIREVCMNILFRNCSIESKMLSSGRAQFLPESLWEYVRCVVPSGLKRFIALMLYSVLQLSGPFDHKSMSELRDWESTPTKHFQAEDDAGIVFVENLQQLPLLDTVHIESYISYPLKITQSKVVPLPILLAILSVPRIRHFSCFGYLCHPSDPILESIQISLPHVASFKYYLPNLRPQPRKYASEVALLEIIIPKLHRNLEVLVLPIEHTPLQQLPRRDWPSLRELVLYGGLGAPLTTPYISILARMPKLRALHLRLACNLGYGPQPICPSGLSVGFPWPELKSLTVMNPHPGDQLWKHLPQSMRLLILQCYPPFWALQHGNRPTSNLWNARVHWRAPLPSASEMLELLRSCRTPGLRQLEIEYRADSSEEALLLHIASAFPSLEVLDLCRYRPVDSPELSLVCGRQIYDSLC